MFPCIGCCVWCRVGTHDVLIRYGYIPHPRKTIPRMLDKLARGLNGGRSLRQRHRNIEFGHIGMNRNSTFFPSAAAALTRLATVRDGLPGSRIRSKEARLVFIREAS